jgi:hypothetical protein
MGAAIMSRKKDHFIAYSICPHCGQPARVRRDGTMRYHTIPIWNDAINKGRIGRCPGVGQKNKLQCCWPTALAAEEGLEALRGTVKLSPPKEEEKVAP